jgi:hypothetical protein
MAIIKNRGGSNKGLSQGSALSMTRADPALAAAVSKAVSSTHGAAYNAQGNRAPAFNEFYAFYSALTRRAQRNSDAEAIMKMLPDIELARQILTSSILSPKDMMNVELILSAPPEAFQADLASSLITRLRTHFTVDYPIEKDLIDMVSEPLFEKGSYPIAVIPENAIDQMINGKVAPSMESLDKFYDRNSGAAKPIGILGSGKPQEVDASKPRFGVSLEAFNLKAKSLPTEEGYLQYNDAEVMGAAFDKQIFITDNPSALKTGQVLDFLKKKRVGNMYSTAMESISMEKITHVTDRMVERAMFRHRPNAQAVVVEAPGQIETHRKSVGRPLVMKLPSESVIPVHVPGDPSRHIGYYIILDENGNPVYAPETDLLNPSAASNQAGTSAQSNLIQRAAMNMGMADPSKFDIGNYQHMQAAVRIYGDMVERDLINRIRNGTLGVNAQVARNEEIYRLMLSRTLAKRYTQVLYLPVEYMTYIAFKYGSDGVGRSMLDDQSMINMLRTTMLMADVVGSIKNSIGRTRVTGTIPENDPDPMGTMEKVIHEIVQSRRLNIPLGVSNPVDIMGFVQQAGLEFEWQGNSGVPDLKLEFQQVQSTYPKPDTELAESLRKSSIMGFGLSPETVDNGFNAEFATTAVANNVLLSKRVIMWQNDFTPQLTNHMRQHARFSEELVTDLYKILKENKTKIRLELETEQGVQLSEELKEKLLLDHALRKFLDGFTASLPQPSSVTQESQMTELKGYTEMLEAALDAYITSDMFTETTAGTLSEQVGTLKAALKAYFQRKWMAEKGIMPELGSIVAADVDGNPQTNIGKEIQSHITSLTKAGVMTLVGLSANRQAATSDLNSVGAVPGPDASSSSFGGGGGGDADFGGGMGGLGGDDFGGDDLGGLGLGEDSSTEDSSSEESSASGGDDAAGGAGADAKDGDEQSGADADGKPAGAA